jgi:hypothetical protein
VDPNRVQGKAQDRAQHSCQEARDDGTVVPPLASRRRWRRWRRWRRRALHYSQASSCHGGGGGGKIFRDTPLVILCHILCALGVGKKWHKSQPIRKVEKRA